MEKETTSYDGESRGVAMNIFAVLGFIALLLAGLWATMQLVKQVSRLSFDFAKPSLSIPFTGGDVLEVAELTTVKPNEKAALNWQLNSDDAGILTFSYACKKGFYIKVQKNINDTFRAIPCNAPYNMPSTDTTMQFIPVLRNDSTTDVAYSLIFTPQEGEQFGVHNTLTLSEEAPVLAIGTTTPLVIDAPVKVVATPTITTPQKDGTMSTRTVVKKPVQKTRLIEQIVPVRNSDPSGMADLVTSITSIAQIASDKITVTFEIANIGTKVVQDWTFAANLPTEPAYNYVSGAQGALYAGERVTMLITFDKVNSGGVILITADAANAITESLETNNTAVQTITLK